MRRLAFVLSLGLMAAPVAAQLFQRSEPQVQTPQSRAEITQSFSPLVKRAAPAVVNVYGARREKVRNPLFDDPFFRELFGGRGQPQERMERSVGSGVIVGADGIVVTNHHVIEGMTELKVSLADRREFDAEVMIRDPKTDLAVLKIKGGSGAFPVLEMGDSDDLEVGDLVLAIGNPFGVGQTVTQGIVSALARNQVDVADYQFFIQTDAAINPGNSGGALIDVKGRLIGINTAIFSKSGGSHGIGFAIPSNMVKVVALSAKAGARGVQRPWYGARLQAVTAEIAQTIGLQRPAGALVSSVVAGGPAEASGLKAGDVIVAVDNVAIDDPDSFGFRFATKPLGGNVQIGILRDGRRLVLPTRLVAAPETRPRDLLKITGRTPFSGLSVVNNSPAVADEMSLGVQEEGLVVTAIESGSFAEEFGFQKGDVLLSINGTKLTATKALQDVPRERGVGWRVSLNRGGQVINAVIGG
jgi:Do/DeqQ family serine protease